MKTKRLFAVFLTVLSLAAGMPAAEVAPARTPKSVRLLTVGNSFSQNATRYLGDLATAGGHALVHRPIVVGGASLQLHAEKAQKHEQDANDKAGRTTLSMDGHHANTAGEYLGACVFYEVLFDDSVVGNAFGPPGLDPAYARFLQETAHQTVVNSRHACCSAGETFLYLYAFGPGARRALLPDGRFDGAPDALR